MIPDPPEAIPVSTPALTEHAGHDRSRQRRRRRWAAGVAAFVLAYALACHPRYEGVRVSPARTVDVISVTQDSGVGRMLGQAGAALGPALVVNYYSGQPGAEGRGSERADIFAWARPRAEQRRLGAVVLWRTEPVASRWLPFVRGDAVAFQRRPDGTWGRF